MSTTTLTTTPSFPVVIPMKASSSSSSGNTTAATLRSLYPRAAHALLQRDVALAHSLIFSAFAILHPPTSHLPDALDAHRRKWDILRITLESTLYAAPPTLPDREALPPPLRANLTLTPSALASELHMRSLRLFTPTFPSQKPSAAYVPPQILVALILAALKVECPDAARAMAEDWLAQREQVEHVRADEEGYEKVLDVYCLHVLPRLNEWDYAQEFLQYEQQLSDISRKRMKGTLESLHAEMLYSSRRRTLSRTPTPISTKASASLHLPVTPPPNRPASPSLSTSSSTSSLDTTSTHTVVPRTPRPKSSATSIARFMATSVASTPTSSFGAHLTPATAASAQRAGTPPPSAGPSIAPARPPRALSDPAHPSLRAAASRSPTVLTLLHAYVRPHLTLSKLTFAFFVVVFPLLSFVMRVRRRRRPGGGDESNGAVAEVKRRLRERSRGGPTNLIRSLWNEITRAIGDTVRMGGSGLV